MHITFFISPLSSLFFISPVVFSLVCLSHCAFVQIPLGGGQAWTVIFKFLLHRFGIGPSWVMDLKPTWMPTFCKNMVVLAQMADFWRIFNFIVNTLSIGPISVMAKLPKMPRFIPFWGEISVWVRDSSFMHRDQLVENLGFYLLYKYRSPISNGWFLANIFPEKSKCAPQGVQAPFRATYLGLG